MRGGSRAGLTRFVSTNMGSISDMLSINLSSTAGTSELLFVLADSTVKTVRSVFVVDDNGDYIIDDNGAFLITDLVSIPTGYLTDDSGNILTDDDGNRLLASSETAPENAFLVSGQQHVFAISSNAIVKINPKTSQTDELFASLGAVPVGCTFGAVYRDRLFLAGADNIVYCSRQGDYTDWNYGNDITDTGRAIAFQLALAADVGPQPTAMIAHKDASLLIASYRSLWIIQGDPATGQIRRVSENVGIIDSEAWCRVDDLVYFLSEFGIYSIGANGSELTWLSDEVPVELQNINRSTTRVRLGYDHDRKNIHVFLKKDTGTSTHWIYELAAKAWWPVRYQSGYNPTAVCQHEGKLLLGGTDGYIRNVDGDNDDGTSISSHIAIGPFRLSNPSSFGRILNMHGIMAEGSGTVNWRIITGDTAERAADNAKAAIEAFQAGGSYSSYVKSSGAWTAGRAIMSYPRTRTVWAVLWLESSAKWAFESVILDAAPSGKWRGG
jgi:hypothetical protein